MKNTVNFVMINNIKHSKKVQMCNGEKYTTYYVYRTTKSGKVVASILNPQVYRLIVSRIEAAIAAQK